MSDSPGSIEIELLMAAVQTRVRQRRGMVDVVVERPRLPSSNWSETIDFGRTGNAAPRLRAGFSPPEEEITWTQSTVAEIEIPVPPAGMDIVLSCDVVPHICRDVPMQTTRVSVDGVMVAVWNVRQIGCHNTLIFSHHFPRHRPTLLRFEMPDAFSPNSKGISADERSLGIALRRLHLQGFNTA